MQSRFAISDATLFAYSITTVVLIINLLVLWIGSGIKRTSSGVAINREDGASRGVPVSETDPPDVARYLRAHRNAEATVYPFLILGMIYILIGGEGRVAIPIFAAFVFARTAHSINYIRAIQPWRTIAFASSLLAIIALNIAIVCRLAMTWLASRVQPH